MALGIHHLGPGFGAVRQAFQAGMRNAGRASEPAVPDYGLSSNSQAVDGAYATVLQMARRCIDSQPQYGLIALDELHRAARRYADAFAAAPRDGQGPGTVGGDLAAALDDARSRLPVQPSHHASSLRGLLNHLLQILERYAAEDPPPALNDFPTLHAGIDAYLKSLGAQPVHVSNGLARLRPGTVSRVRTPEDIHMQALQMVRPQGTAENRPQAAPAPSQAPAPAEAGLPAAAARLQEEEPLAGPPPGYAPHPDEVFERVELPADLALRLDRYLRKLNKEPGLSSLIDPDPSTLLGELKVLLGREIVSPAQRGEILMRLAEGIRHRPGRAAVPEPEQLARLYLRFLAPQQLPPKFTQSPAAIRAGVNTDEFDPEALVPGRSKVMIVEAMIRQLGHLAHAGTTACLVLQTALRDMENNTVLHANLLNRAAHAIKTIQHSRRDVVSFHHWYQTIVDALTALDAAVHADLVQADIDALRPHVLGLRTIAYELRGLPVQQAPGDWSGRLEQLPAYRRLWENLNYAERVPPGDPPPEANPPAYS